MCCVGGVARRLMALLLLMLRLLLMLLVVLPHCRRAARGRKHDVRRARVRHAQLGRPRTALLLPHALAAICHRVPLPEAGGSGHNNKASGARRSGSVGRRGAHLHRSVRLLGPRR